MLLSTDIPSTKLLFLAFYRMSD